MKLRRWTTAYRKCNVSTLQHFFMVCAYPLLGSDGWIILSQAPNQSVAVSDVTKPAHKHCLDAVLIMKVHVVWPLTQELEAHKVFRRNKESNTLYIPYQTKTNFLNFQCGFSPLSNLGTNHHWIYNHLLSLSCQKKENLGELIEVAKLTWNSYMRAAVDGGLQGGLQRILFWNSACPYLDGGLLSWEREIPW